MDTRIYICTHKKFSPPHVEGYLPLRVGAALSDEDFGYQRDDEGDNISEKNRSFCELTGLYWVWKNVSADIVGISHYRRYFENDNDFLMPDDIESILEDHDIIVPYSTYTNAGSIRDHYEKEHHIKDLDLVGEIIDELCPEYKPAYNAGLDGDLFNPVNMIVAKKETYDSYCSWLFPILFELEKRSDISDYDDYQSRVFGFMSERLLRIWILMQKLRVYEMKVTMIDPENAYNNNLILEKKKRLLELKVQDLLTLYRTGNPTDVFPYTPGILDTGDRIPVWVCWWQGFENAPELVQLCKKSMYKNLDQNLFEIIELNFENYSQFVEFPDWIAARFNDEKITMTQLSDMLRMALLYYYGGIWMDATYFIANKIGENHPLYTDPCYTIRLRSTGWKTDVTEGNWAGNFLKTPKGAILPRFVMNAFYYYYLTNEDSADYFMIDYFIRMAYEYIDEVKNDINSIVFSQSRSLELEKHMNEIFDKESFDSYASGTDFFKLSYKSGISAQNIIGQDTIFGGLCKIYAV